jgi:tRNA(Leu) C34 or U34 (ribose-2'-O)-methylase TrmL
MLRELHRNGFWLEGKDAYDPSAIEKIKPQAFMPRKKICKMLGLDYQTASSVRIYEKIEEMLPESNTLDGTFDILFIEKEF